MKNNPRRTKSHNTNKDVFNATVLLKPNFPIINKKLSDVQNDIEDLYKRYKKIRKERVNSEKNHQIMVNRVNYLLVEQKRNKLRNPIKEIEKQNESKEKTKLKIHVKKNSKIKHRIKEKPRLKSEEKDKKDCDNILNNEKIPDNSVLNMTEISINQKKFKSPKNMCKNLKSQTINSNSSNKSDIIEVKVSGILAKKNHQKINNLHKKIKNKQDKSKTENRLINNNTLNFSRKSFSTNKHSYFNKLNYSNYSSSSSKIGIIKHLRNNSRNKKKNNKNHNTNYSSKIINQILNNFSTNQFDINNNKDYMNKSFQKSSENFLEKIQINKKNYKKSSKQNNIITYKKIFNDILLKDNNYIDSPSIDDTLSFKSSLRFENHYNTLNNTVTNYTASSPAFSEFSCKIGKINLNENKSNNLIYKKKIMPKCNVIICHRANLDKLNGEKEIIKNLNIDDEYKKNVQFSEFNDDIGINYLADNSQKKFAKILKKNNKNENLNDDKKLKETFNLNSNSNINKNKRNRIYKHYTYNNNHNGDNNNNNKNHNETTNKILVSNSSYRVNIEKKKKELFINPLLNTDNSYNKSCYIKTESSVNKQILDRMKLKNPIINFKKGKICKNINNKDNKDSEVNMIKVQKRKETLDNNKVTENKKGKKNNSKIALKDINYNLNNSNVMFNPISAFKSFEKKREKRSLSRGKDTIDFRGITSNYI